MFESPPLNPNPNPLERDWERRRLPASFETPATSIDSESARLSFQEQFMYKNRLQEFTQKSAIALPVYETVSIGHAHAHAPQFRSTVLVDGLTFTSPSLFSNRKAAEQHVAKLALESISRKIEDESVSLIQEDTIFCKSIIHEYAAKICHEKITYTTYQAEGILPVFASSIIFNGQTYTGHPAKSKKEAEQMAAHAVIESILAHSDTRTLMCEIIRSKRKLYAALGTTGSSSSLSSESVPLRIQNNPNDVVNGKKVLENLTNNKLPESMCTGHEQNAKAIATGTLTPEAKILKEGYTRELCFGDEGSGRSQQTFPLGSSLASMANDTSNPSDGSLSHDHINSGVKKIGPSARPEGSPCVVLTSGMKRSDATGNEEPESKKSRTAEQLPTPAADP